MPDINLQKQGPDIGELLSCLTQNKLGITFEEPAILKKIELFLKSEDKTILPKVIGLFGGWGSGKTSLLAHVAKTLIQDNPEIPVIYFNAWKYGSTSDILPALIYKILSHPLILTKDLDPEKIGAMLLSYIKDADFRKTIAKVFFKKERVDAAEMVWKKIEGINQAIDPNMIAHFLSTTDRNIKTVQNALENKPPSLVIIDELDRCDPDEAYGLIKELKVLFGSHKLPLLFVLSVNPDPIGMAIKNRYGFDDEVCEYESIRILEKFVDIKFDIINDVNLFNYIEDLFDKNHDRDNSKLPDSIRNACDVFKCADKLDNKNNVDEWWGILNKEIHQLSNLRIISKCVESIAIREYLDPNLYWPTLHMELLRNSNYAFAKKLYMISEEIEAIAHCCHILFHNEQKESSKVKFEYYNYCYWGCWRAMTTFFESDRMYPIFGEKLRQFLKETPEQLKLKAPRRKVQLMQEILEDFKLMDSVKHLTLIRDTKNKSLEKIFNDLGKLISMRV